MTLERFFGFNTNDDNMKVIYAVHMFAVYTAVNIRRAKECITGEEEMYQLIMHGHKKAQTVANNLSKIYHDAMLS